MIILQIRAQNVLKYAKLSIDLAEQGLIAISGQNESGKSSIGETLCFALFGRTFSIPPQETHKVIRWGESHCSAEVTFRVADQDYVLSRYLDRDGHHSARLVKADAPDEPIARGIDRVADDLFKLLGFSYDEFVESFYLAQREITTPHPHSQAVKIMAGVAPLEQVMRNFDSEIEERHDLLGELQAERDAVEQDVRELAIDDERMPWLEQERHQAAHQVDEINTLLDEMDGSLKTYTENSAEIARLQGAKGRNSFLRFIFFLLAAIAAGVWGLLSYAPDHPQTAQLHELLAANVSAWDESKLVLIGYAAIALGVVFVLLWVRQSSLKQRIGTLRDESARLADVLERARTVDVEPIEPEAEAYDVPDDDGEYDGETEPVAEFPRRPEQSEFESVRRLVANTEATVRMAADYGEREGTWLGAVSNQLSTQLAGLDDDIGDESARLHEASNLAEVLAALKDKREDINERIADRKRGLELLQGSVLHLSSNFNRDVKNLVGRLLPLFTDGRYEHLQIDEGLKVRVFSSEKRDFMDLDEVSSGTQRQIMLALRLALSKKLLSRTGEGGQFAFLDEPFAFFDEERTRKALQALADLGDDISQVWIVAQGFPDNCDVDFDTRIHCDRSSDTLEVSV